MSEEQMLRQGAAEKEQLTKRTIATMIKEELAGETADGLINPKEQTDEILAAEDQVVDGVHNYSGEDTYIWPEDPAVQKQLEWFMDQKLGLMLHWGHYSQLGIVESWALSDADASWSRECIDWETDARGFKQDYFDLNKTFNPIRFEPEKWAEAAWMGGFRYCVMTTKHHDGFCMWDSKYSDYKITAPDCPFHKHKYADICSHLFEAMRKKGIGAVAYFSKADWHIDSYWQKDSFTSRGPSYCPAENPAKWEEFVQFTHNQVKELVSEYGRLEALWFDAGWVCRQNGQDIRIEEMIADVRKIQPWILSADRTVGGPCENYVTPEQCVPEKPLTIPWESCITLGTSFSFRYEDTYKTPREVACLLVDIIAKGGNLALNIGPQPDGRLPEGALRTIKELGQWLSIYGEAIYETRVCSPYKKDGIAFTQNKSGKIIYAFRMYEEPPTSPETELFLPYQSPITAIECLGHQTPITYHQTQDGWTLANLPKTDKNTIGLIFRIHTN